MKCILINRGDMKQKEDAATRSVNIRYPYAKTQMRTCSKKVGGNRPLKIQRLHGGKRSSTGHFAPPMMQRTRFRTFTLARTVPLGTRAHPLNIHEQEPPQAKRAKAATASGAAKDSSRCGTESPASSSAAGTSASVEGTGVVPHCARQAAVGADPRISVTGSQVEATRSSSADAGFGAPRISQTLSPTVSRSPSPNR